MLVSKLQTTVGNENLDPINLENFNQSLKILESEKVPEYQSTIDEAARLAEKFETRNNCTLALCFLYDVPIATHLNDPEAVDDLRCDIHTLVDWAAEVYGSPGKDDIVALTSALGKMKDVFDANTSWDTADTVHSISLWQQVSPGCVGSMYALNSELSVPRSDTLKITDLISARHSTLILRFVNAFAFTDLTLFSRSRFPTVPRRRVGLCSDFPSSKRHSTR